MNCKIVRHLGPETKKRTVAKKIPDTGHAAVITGASSGLGRELAIAFSQTGHVILSGRNQSRLEDTQARCKDPGNTTLVCGDLGSTDVCRDLASFADLYSARYLICCAAEYQKKKLLDTACWDNERILTSNLASTIKLVRLTLPVLKRTGGSIININSLAGRNASPEEAAYSASKHGLAGLFKALRLEVRESGIRVQDVYLGAIRSQMTRLRKDFNYLMDPQEIAEVIHYNAEHAPPSLQLEEMVIGRFLFPPR